MNVSNREFLFVCKDKSLGWKDVVFCAAKYLKDGRVNEICFFPISNELRRNNFIVDVLLRQFDQSDSLFFIWHLSDYEYYNIIKLIFAELFEKVKKLNILNPYEITGYENLLKRSIVE